MPDDTFKDKIDALAAGDNAGADSTSAPAASTPKKKGRPVGYSPKAAKEAADRAAADAAKVVPPVNELEASLFADIFVGIANAFIKKEYRDKLYFTKEEMLNITRPAVQLKAYYLPNFGGIYAVWMQFGLAAGGLGLAKYQIISEIIDAAPKDAVIIDGKKDSPYNGDQGNGQVNEGQGIISPKAESINL